MGKTEQVFIFIIRERQEEIEKEGKNLSREFKENSQ